MPRVHAVDYSSLLVYLFSKEAIPWGDCVMGKDKKSRNLFSAWQPASSEYSIVSFC